MAQKVVHIRERTKLRGIRVPLNVNNAIIEESGDELVNSYAEILASKNETSADNNSKNKAKGVSNLEITPKEYIDDRIGALEKSMDEKFVTQEKILAGKIDLVHKDIEHLHTKIESSLETRFNSFKTQLSNEQKESRRFIINTILVSVGIATAVIIGALGFVIK